MLLVPTFFMAAIGVVSVAAGRGLQGDVHEMWYGSFLPSAHLFAMGMAIAVLRVELEDGRIRLPRYWRFGALVMILAVGASTIELQVQGRIPGSADVALLSIPCSLLLALVVLRGGGERISSGVRILESRPLVAVGLISYSVYLWHAPVYLLSASARVDCRGRGVRVSLQSRFRLRGDRDAVLADVPLRRKAGSEAQGQEPARHRPTRVAGATAAGVAHVTHALARRPSRRER